jgi:hypothetical protein
MNEKENQRRQKEWKKLNKSESNNKEVEIRINN